MNSDAILKGVATYTGKLIKYDTYNIAIDQINGQIHVCILFKDEETLFSYPSVIEFLLDWKNVNVYNKMITTVPKSFYAMYENIEKHK